MRRDLYAVAMHKRRDSLINPQTGLGDQSSLTLDTRTRTVRRPDTWRPAGYWNAEWLESPWARREVSQLTSDMVRKGVRVVGLPEWVDTQAVHERINADIDYRPDGSLARNPGYLHYIERLAEQGDKVGGAVLLPVMEDGMDPAEPLDWRRIRRIDEWVVLDRSEVTPFSYTGTTSAPEFYVLSDVLAVPSIETGKRGPSRVSSDYLLQPGDIIHRSRLAFNLGRELSRREMRRRFWWGASVLENNMLARAGLEYGDAQLSTYIDRTVTMNFQIGGLNELQAVCDEEGVNVGERNIQTKTREAVQASHGTGFIVTDGGTPTVIFQDDAGTQTMPGRNPDKIEQIVTPTDALVEINRYNRDQWQAGAGIPPSIAFGQAPSGLRGGKNEGDWQSWQGVVETKQKWATYVLKWMLSLLFASKDGPSGGVPIDPNSYKIEWTKLLTPTPEEEARIARQWAEIDGIRQGQTAQRPDETRQHRVVDGETVGPVPAIEQPADEGEGLQTSLVGIASNALDVMKAVAAAELPAPAGAYLLRKTDPSRFEDADAGVALAAPQPITDAADIPDPPDEIAEAWAAGAPPDDAAMSTELAADPALDGKIGARSITNMGKNGEIKVYPDLRRGKHVPVYSRREVLEVLMRRRGDPQTPNPSSE